MQRLKPVTCLEPVLSVSLSGPGQYFPGPSKWPALALSQPAPLSLSLSVVARKSPGYGLAWDFSIPPRLVWARQPPSPSVLRVCMFRDENRVLDNVL